MLGLSILSRHHHTCSQCTWNGGCIEMLHFLLFCFKGLKRHGMGAWPDALEADNHGGNVCPWKVFWMPSFLATCCKQKCQINIKFFVCIIIIVPCHYCSSVHGKINLDFFFNESSWLPTFL